MRYTQNLLLKGAAVDIGIVGRTGLATEDYDQTIVVSGNPSGPLAVAGALAAGPVDRRWRAGAVAALQGPAAGTHARLLSCDGPVGRSGRAANLRAAGAEQRPGRSRSQRENSP